RRKTRASVRRPHVRTGAGMTRLETPLKEHLRDPASEEALARMWRHIDGRFPRRSRSLLERRGLGGALVPVAAVAAVAIVAGLATVAVVGTHFECARDTGRLRVSVQRGSVLVRGERVPERARRLEAGQTIEVSDGDAREPAVVLGPTGEGASSQTRDGQRTAE